MSSPGGKIKVTADSGSCLHPFPCFLYVSGKKKKIFTIIIKKFYNWQSINLAGFLAGEFTLESCLATQKAF